MPIRFEAPTDIAFSIFGLDIYYYGIIMALAILAGFFCAYKLTEKFYSSNSHSPAGERVGVKWQTCVKNPYSDFIIDYSPYLIMIGVVGARLYYCLVNFSYYSVHPIEILNIRQGGLSIHGMIIVGFLALYLFSRIKKLSFWKLSDIYLCSSLLAQGIGRWGNFFNNEAFGYPTNMPWGLYIPLSKRPLEYTGYEYFHPTFLYESVLDFIGFIILLWVFKRYHKRSGFTACMYLIIYSLIRIFVESFRVDSILYIAGLPVATVMSLVLIFSAIILAVWRSSGKINWFKR